MLRALRLLLPLLCILGGLRAQSVRWEPSSGDLPRNQSSQLSLIFEDAEPKDTPSLPAVDGLSFGTPSRSQSSSINITGSRTIQRRTITYSFPIRPTRADGEIRIPAFTVETDAGRLTVPPAGFRLAEATVGQTGLPLDQIVAARFIPPAAPVWAGEVFRLGFQLDVDRRYATNNILGAPLDWASSPLVAEEWSKPTGSETAIDGRPRFLVGMETRAVAPVASSAQLLALPTGSQTVNLPTGQANPFSLFGQSTFEQFTVTTAPARVAINPLPSPAPADFIGAVGRFTLSSKVVPETATVGEPITWTLTLEGVGNWPAVDRILPRSLSRDFRVVTPRAQKTIKPETLFEGALSEDLVLIPQKPGRTTLGPYTLSIFNPATGAYETLRTDPVTIEVTASAAAPTPPAPAPTPGDTAEPAPPSATPAPPASVATLPADPLPPGLLGAAPFARWPGLLFWTPLALLLPAALWLALASRHARLHDPLRYRRAAHAELRRILSSMEQGAGGTDPNSKLLAPSSRLLLAWQHATRALFDLPILTPTARDIPEPLWAELWAETDRALYRPETPLAREWFAQAWQAHAQATPPPRGALAALRPAHLFPRALLWLCVLHCSFGLIHPSFAAPEGRPDAHVLYARGDFSAAEAATRSALRSAPLDASLRHNLSLALAQQGRWDEAHALALAASFQRPGDPALERLLAVTASKASYRIHPIPTLAGALAPRDWQLLALASALALLVLPPAAYLLALYRPSVARRLPLVVGHSSLVIAAAALAFSLLALRAHGPAADPAAVLVWRAATLRAVPTEVGEQKITADLSAGTIARVDKDFLGWRRVVLPDGNTGWVRAESLVPLWR